MENRKKPKIRFKGFTNAWEQCKLDKFLTLSRVQGHTGLEAKKLTVKLWGKGIVEKIDSYGGSKNTQYSIRKHGQFMYGKLDFLHAAFGIVPKSLDGYESTLDSPAFDLNNIIGDFLLNRVIQEDFYLKNGMIANGSRKAKRIYEDVFLNMKIAIPKLEEQKSIAIILKRVDQLITLHQRKCEKLQNIKKSLLEKMFPKNNKKYPEIRFKGFTNAWEQKKIEDICSISTGKSNTQDQVSDGVYPFYVRSPIVERSNRYLFDEEAVLTVGDGVGTGKVFHYVKGKYDLHQRVYRMFDFNNDIKGKYFYYYFSNHFYDRVMSMTAKSSVDSVRHEMIAKMKLAYPNKKEQKNIAILLENLDKLLTLHQQQINKLQNIKKALLEKMFV